MDEDTKLGNLFGTFIILLIILNMAAIILESVKSLHDSYEQFFVDFEHFCLFFFTIEYIVRVITAQIKYGQKGAKPYFKYIFSFMALVDLFAILPSLLILVLPAGVLAANFQFIRMLRIMRIFRVLKITRYSGSLKMMGEVLKDKASDLSITIFITFVLMILASTLMYYAEHNAQPDQFPDIVHAFWWAVATLTTVGYGDVYPVTALGKILSGVIAILGIGLVALPTGILSSAFVDKMTIMRAEKARKKKLRKEGIDEDSEADEESGAASEEAILEQHAQDAAASIEAEVAEASPEVKKTVSLTNGYAVNCPHDTLIASGDFPQWMKFCPLCGEEINAETVPSES